MKQITLLGLFLLLVNGIQAQEEYAGWHKNYEEGLAEAKATGKPMLLVFSGSDWCKPCIKLARGIFATETFQRFADDSLILVNLDFPVSRSLQPDKEELASREAAAERFNKEGAFPAVVLLTPEEKQLGRTGYLNLAPRGYVDHLKTFLVSYAYPKPTSRSVEYKLQGDFLLMGSKFEIAAISTDSALARKAILEAKQEVERIEALISSWDDASETHAINMNAGKQTTKVSAELFGLIHRAGKLSELTGGAFDISFASIDKIWTFNRTELEMPSQEVLDASVAKIDYRKILLDLGDTTVFLQEEGMKIGFGAIGKGYAANRAKLIMQSIGIESGMVNAGGDLIAWGDGFQGETWRIGIADPNRQKGVVSWIEVKDMAVVTSGDYERYALIDGKRYSHIIDPRTGMPVTGLKSVTILCEDAEIADGLATSVSILGPEKGLQLINGMPGVECILILDNNDIKSSENISLSFLTDQHEEN